MTAILFSLPGSPVLYYGDEIGMGDNVYLGDRDGVRTPMQWTGDRNGGLSRADFAQLYLPPKTRLGRQHRSEAANADIAVALGPRFIALRKASCPQPRDVRAVTAANRIRRTAAAKTRSSLRPQSVTQRAGRELHLSQFRPLVPREMQAPRSSASASCPICLPSRRAASTGSNCG